MSPNSHRTTLRKHLITEIIASEYLGKPVLLEELRCKVYLRELAHHQQDTKQLTSSYMKSFARTVRDHMPELFVYKLRRPTRIPIGIIARAAFFRCQDMTTLTMLTEAPSLYCYIQFKPASVQDAKPDPPPYIRPYVVAGSARYSLDRRRMIYFWFCTSPTRQYDEACAHRACMPVNLPLSFIGTSLYTNDILHLTVPRCTIFQVATGRSRTYHAVLPNDILIVPKTYTKMVKDYKKLSSYSDMENGAILAMIIRNELTTLIERPHKRAKKPKTTGRRE